MTTVDRPAPVGVSGAASAAAALGTLAAVLLLVAGWHTSQGTSGIAALDLLRWMLGEADSRVGDVLVSSRLPRMLAGLVVGVALGSAGALFQSLARNALAAPDTLAVNTGAWFVLTLGAALGITVPLLGEGLLAFVGGLLAAGLVLLLAGGGGASTTRLILAGSALTLALSSATGMLLILFDQETSGLFAWGSGSLTQLDLDGVARIGPVVVVGLAAALLLSRRLDLLALGDDTARVLGVRVVATRVVGTLLAVLLAASAVALAGPLGFIGLCAPALVRLAGRVAPVLRRHVVLLPASGLAGAIIVLAAECVMRTLLGAEGALTVPTGVATTLLGAAVLIAMARRASDAGPTRRPAAARTGGHHSRLRFVLVTSLLVGVLVAAALLGLMAGYTWLLTGDLVNWARGAAVPVVEFAMDERTPRVAAALAGGAALALAGTVVQAVCRNPLAEPGLLGITGGAGLGAVVLVVSTAGVVSTTAMSVHAAVGALVAFSFVYGLAWRGGLDSDRLVLIGIGMWFGTTALTTMLIIRANPFDTPRIFTWLSGSTYERSWGQVVPVAVALLVALPLAWLVHRELDLLAVDDDTPRVVGVRLEAVRVAVLAGAAVLTSTAVAAVGVVGFVGLVAPHAARALVAGRHARVVPVAVLLGAVLLSLADTFGRSVIAPAQVPAGLVVAVIGAPYFVWLLHRSRA